MLTAWRFAPWANGTASLSDADDVRFRLADRLRRGADPPARKSLTYRLPDDLSPSGAWGRWIAWLLDRYAGRIDALEIVNEPNLQLWPQRDAAGALTIDAAVATMMQTPAALASRQKRAPLLVAPATGDPVGDSRLRTGYDTFTRALLDRLRWRGFEPRRRGGRATPPSRARCWTGSPSAARSRARASPGRTTTTPTWRASSPGRTTASPACARCSQAAGPAGRVATQPRPASSSPSRARARRWWRRGSGCATARRRCAARPRRCDTTLP